jgi:segregation and condensation protein A
MSDRDGAADVEASAWEEPRPVTAMPTGSAPILSVEGFEGPLDWLLEMVRAQKIDLGTLPILALVTGFVTALKRALAGREQTAPLGRWGDSLVMAANLALLRSRLLLPADTVEAQAAADEADLLRRQLVSRAEIREAADWLDRRPQLNREVFPRGRGEAQVSGERAGDIVSLLRACLAALSLPEGAEPYRPRPPPVWRVSDAIGLILARLDLVPEEGAALAALLPSIAAAGPERESWSRVAVATTFLAGLELARAGEVVLDQPRPWDSIQLQRAAARVAEGQSSV